MRLLADQNIPMPSVQRLRQAGHDVASILEDAAGVDDETVLQRAVREGRILLTFDSQFVQLVYQSGRTAKPDIVFFRISILQSPEQPADLLIQALPILVWGSMLTVITRNRVRQPPLP